VAKVDSLESALRGQSRQHQLPLEVQLRDDATLDNFLAVPAVQPLMAGLQQQREPAGEAMILVYGPAGSGKSHLLQASCRAASSASLYLPLPELRQYDPADVLQGVEALDLVCLDDVHAVLGDAGWELALFNLCNRARERDCKLLLAANAAPRALSVDLQDLRSRLSWGVVYQLAQADDEEKAAILQFRASRRGLALSAEVTSYIVRRAPRALDQLLGLLDILDRHSLAQQRALSIPFVKQVLGW
jgi:DnaA family protein